MSKNYSSEEIEQILRIALMNRNEGNEESVSNIYEIAKELNIDEKSVDNAIKRYEQLKEVNRYKEEYLNLKKKKFKNNLITYSVVNMFLILLNIASSGSVSWSLFPLLGWGLGVALNGLNAYRFNEEEFKKYYKKIQRQQKGNKFAELIDLGLNKAIDVIKEIDINEINRKKRNR